MGQKTQGVSPHMYYYYNPGQGTYFHLSFQKAVLLLCLGPIASGYMGFFELTILYGLAFVIPHDFYGLAAFHLAYSITIIFLVPVSLRIRKYEKSTRENVMGRFQELSTVW